MMRSTFAVSRYIVLIAVVALLLCSLAVFVFGGFVTVNTILGAFGEAEFNAEGARFLSVEMIELVDLFLLGTILLITSLGLYQLFVDPAIGETLPPWLSVHSLEQLKFNLVAVLVVMLLILFLGAVAGMESLAEGQGVAILAFGGGIALVVVAAAVAVKMLGDVTFKIEERHEHTEHGEVVSPSAHDV